MHQPLGLRIVNGLALLLAACAPGAEEEAPKTDSSAGTSADSAAEDTADPDTAPPIDLDGDGYAAEEDCADDDAARNPGAAEIPYDGIDQDCDGADLADVDDDGVPWPEDCADDDPEFSPVVTESPTDGIDNDCDGYVDFDNGSLDNVSIFVEGTDTPPFGDPQSWFGAGIRVLEDRDGDGGADILVSGGDRVQFLYTSGAFGREGATLSAESAAITVFSSATDLLPSAARSWDDDEDGIRDLWIASFGSLPENGTLHLVPSAAMSPGTLDPMDVASAQIAIDDEGTWLEHGRWSSESDLDADGLDDVCTPALVNPAETGAWGICCISATSISGATLRSCADADGQVSSDTFVVSHSLWSVGDIDGDGTEGLVTWNGSFVGVYDGETLLAGYQSEAADVIAARLDVGRHYSITEVPNDDIPEHPALLLVHGGAISTVWTDLASGGTRALADAAGVVTFDGAGHNEIVYGASNVGSLGATERDVVFSVLSYAGPTGLFFLPAADLPTDGTTLDLATRSDFLQSTETALAGRGRSWDLIPLTLADLDFDGDDDVLAGNYQAHQGFLPGDPNDDPGGVLSVIYNPAEPLCPQNEQE